MVFRVLKLFTVLHMTLAVTGLGAQEVTNASGGNASGSGGIVSYSVGQVAYTLKTATSGSVNEGAQQPYEISVLSGIKDAQFINLLVSAYPNPATDFLILRIENYDSQKLSYYLFDLNSRLLERKEITDKETRIDMSRYMSGSFILRLTDSNREIKTFKIIKY